MRKSLYRVIQSAMQKGADITWAPGYAEPGYNEDTSIDGVYMADWNVVRRLEEDDSPQGSHWVITDRTLSRIGELLEKEGVSTEWSDEWITCDDCGHIVRTSPDSMWWEPAYDLVNDCEIVCHECSEADRKAALEEERNEH